MKNNIAESSIVLPHVDESKQDVSVVTNSMDETEGLDMVEFEKSLEIHWFCLSGIYSPLLIEKFGDWKLFLKFYAFLVHASFIVTVILAFFNDSPSAIAFLFPYGVNLFLRNRPPDSFTKENCKLLVFFRFRVLCILLFFRVI